MRDNASIRVLGQKLELVPYVAKFVERYHKWMQDPFLLEMTASEPLTIDEEYEMQMSWREDPKKCTFILLSRLGATDMSVEDDQISRMVGDVNLFLQDFYYVFVGDEQVERREKNAEIDVMIAEASFRGQGMGTEAVLLMLWFAVKQLGIQRFFAKIREDNESSLELFKRIGFKQTHYVAAFREVELQLSHEDEIFQSLIERACGFAELHAFSSEPFSRC